MLGDKLYKKTSFLDIIFIAALISITCIVFYYNTRDIQLKIAYKGYGPQDYVNQKLYPENFQKNWPSGIMVYENSLPMRVHYYLAKHFGISPTTTMHPHMFIQTLLFLLSVAFLTQTLFQNKFVTIICVIIIPLSNMAGLNLSRFGAGYGSLLSWPLYYGYADAFRFFALSFFLRNRYVLCFVLLALSIYCHVNMGLFALAFISAYVFYRPSLFYEKSFIKGLLVFLVLVVPHILSIISNAAISSGGIPVDQWVKSTRIFSFHWYPITMKLFTTNAHTEFFPFLLLCFFFFVALRYQDIKNEKNLKIILGCFVCLIMTLIGITFSDIYPIPFLTKMSLQRSTGLITFFGVLYIVYYLFRKMDSGNMLSVFLSVYGLLILVFAKPGIAMLPLYLLLYSDIREGHFGPTKIESNGSKSVKLCYYMSGILLALFTLIFIFKDNLRAVSSIYDQLWTPLQYFSPFRGFDFLLRGGGFKVYPIFVYLLIGSALIAGATIILRDSRKRSLSAILLNIFLVISISIVWYLERDKHLRWHNKYAEIASSYLDVQLWARKNTPHDALFMPDPSHSYGWRDFSERSSFGNLREWGYCAIAYNPDYDVYQQGVGRMKEFGIDIERITDKDLKDSTTFIYGQRLNRKLRRVFYCMKSVELEAFTRKYEIDYVVMNKKYHKSKFNNVKTAYENKHYIVYKL